jgi:hypothetical protein
MKWLGAFAVVALVLAGCSGKPAQAPATGKDFFDNFEPHEFPVGWERPAGRWELMDNETPASGIHVVQQLSRLKDSMPHAVAKGRGTYDDFDASVKVRLVAGDVSKSGGLAFRYVDVGNYYVARISGIQGNAKFIEYDHATMTQKDPAYAGAFPSNEWFDLKVRAQGSKLTLFVNGQQAAEIMDESLTVGYVGLWAQDDSNTQFDDLRVTKL